MKYPDESLQNYWSPAQVRLYVGGVWIDDACFVQYVTSDPKIPKYGYFDRTYRAVASGPTIIQGQLHINFRFNGYLRGVISNELKKRKDLDYLMDNNSGFRTVSHNIEDVLNMSLSDQLVILAAIAQSQPKHREAEFEKYKNSGWEYTKWADRHHTYPTPYPPPVVSPKLNMGIEFNQAYNRPGLFSEGFDIMMVWGTDPDNPDPALTRLIKDVHLVNESVQVEIEVPDGGRAIREVYRFLAKDILSGDPAKSAPTSGGASGGAR